MEKGVKNQKRKVKRKISFLECLNLSDHQINTDCYLLRMLYMNLMVTTNTKPMTDTQKIKRKKAKYYTIHTHLSQRMR